MARIKPVSASGLVKLVGSNAEVANLLGVTRQAVWNWVNRRAAVPQKYHIRIANLFPDKYGYLLNG